MTHNLKKTNRLKTITPSSSLLPLSYQDSLFPISLQPLLKQGKASRRYLEKSSPKCLLDS